ncbi:unnamed protein product, partial [Rotaria magnacalcarata]
GLRPLLTSLSSTSNSSLLSGQQQVQPVTQMILQQQQQQQQQQDSHLQRSFISSTATLQQPQIITVNHQPIKTE